MPFALLGFALARHALLARPVPPPAAETPVASLPDSPGALLFAHSSDSETEPAAFASQATNASGKPMVKVIEAGRPAPTQQPHDKVLLGPQESLKPFSMLGWATSAGWSQLIDGIPEYGTWDFSSTNLAATSSPGSSSENTSKPSPSGV
jgi:hypothetical protein